MCGFSTVGICCSEGGVESGDNGTDGDGDFGGGGGGNRTHNYEAEYILFLTFVTRTELNAVSIFV